MQPERLRPNRRAVPAPRRKPRSQPRAHHTSYCLPRRCADHPGIHNQQPHQPVSAALAPLRSFFFHPFARNFAMTTSTRTELVERTQRPWGWYETVSEAAGNKIKRIQVAPGQQLSLQKHQHRAEHWVVTQGTARVTLDAQVFDLTVGQHCDIAQGQVHRLANLTQEVVEIVEVQFGHYLGEDDIIRLQDDYGRQ